MCDCFCRSGKDIQNVEIISTNDAGTNMNDIQSQSKVIVKKPIAKKAGRSISECVSMSTVQAGASQIQMHFKKPVELIHQQAEQTPNGKIALGKFSICLIYTVLDLCMIFI